jgi:hypothetical protein
MPISPSRRARPEGGFPMPDDYIAAFSAAQNFAVASRDISAFAAAGLKAIDPWKVSAEDLSTSNRQPMAEPPTQQPPTP